MPDNNTKSNTKVEISSPNDKSTNTNDNSTANTSPSTNNTDATDKDEYNYQFHILTANQLALGQAMNCQVEKFRAYVNVLKGVLSRQK